MRRHDLLQVDQEVWSAMLELHPALIAVPLVADWASNGRPAMVRRPMVDDLPGAITAALSLPPGHGQRRVAFSLGSSLASAPGVSPRHPVLLCNAATSAPADWQTTIARLLELGTAIDVAPSVFGALMWQHVTGLDYLTAQSDIDLLWRISDDKVANTLVAGLRRVEAQSPIRIDGEIERPDGSSVNWRELALAAESGGGDVLIKSMHGVDVCHVADFFVMEPVA